MAPTHDFIALYEREAEAVLVFCTRRTFDVELSLDLTAETFAQAWRAWPGVRSDSPEEMRAWLFTIARRQLSGYWRRGRVERRAVARMGIETPTIHEDDIEEIERAAGLPVLRVALAGELAKLTAEQREALQLRVVDEVPYPELARRLGINEPTARARVSRGLRALAAALDPKVDARAVAAPVTRP